ncbi:hypothetical protein SARC_03522 [Sphaeroforma arctica JP610]|uniref:MRG domain-containing protein n=1 Tax=Sphaeroforma arctica JP610 TaxID=667725 RepID=A0A0L0G5Y2_9EUKA|nr:hypothetical protein SARC_03522 [Sphaeroforma arctica JP610]KNC84251.1 hypothetical protein SARC_03522 [Sphaeroforma arctica JP610]|eukprot:XP_014158153.1 hypothetical protein SARC_03522 [Sphaeroforma arctica JP610]
MYHTVVRAMYHTVVRAMYHTVVRAMYHTVVRAIDAELAELQSGLIAFFDMALGTYLLYPFERCQYRDVLHDTNWKTLGSVYGAEHLLRLLSVLPALIDEHDLEKEQKNPLVNYCTDLATYLSLNIDTLFVKEYHNVNTAYTRLSTTS